MALGRCLNEAYLANLKRPEMATQKPVAEEFCLLVGKSLESLLTYLELVFFNVS